MERRDTINSIHRKTIPIRLIPDRQLKWSVDVTLLLVSPDVKVGGARSLVGQSVDQEWVAMEIENNGPVGGEDRCVFAIRQTMRMVNFGNQLEEIDDVNESNLEIGNVFSEECGGGECFKGRNITTRGEYDIRIKALVVGSPVPDS